MLRYVLPLISMSRDLNQCTLLQDLFGSVATINAMHGNRFDAGAAINIAPAAADTNQPGWRVLRHAADRVCVQPATTSNRSAPHIKANPTELAAVTMLISRGDEA